MYHSKNKTIMAKKTDEKDILLVRDEKTGQLGVVGELHKDGSPRTVPAKQERSIKAREIGLEKMKHNGLYVSRFAVFCNIHQNASLGSIMRGFRYQVITCSDAA